MHEYEYKRGKNVSYFMLVCVFKYARMQLRNLPNNIIKNCRFRIRAYMNVGLCYLRTRIRAGIRLFRSHHVRRYACEMPH